jgi:hypothetical protein
MTEAFRSPPPAPDYPGQAAARQEVTQTVQRIMGEGITPPVEPPSTPRHRSGSDGPSTTDVAKDQAGQVADTAKEVGAHVVGTVQEQAGQVTAQAGRQAKQLLAQAQSEVNEQAAATQQRVAQGLHALADELTGMAKNSDQDGPATDVARQAADRAHQAAAWLADRDPGTLLDEVRSFARRKPGTYLAVALGAGVLAGRLTRGLTASDDTPAPNSTGTDPVSAGSSAGLLDAGPVTFDGSESFGNQLGSNAPARGTTRPRATAPVGGLDAGGGLGAGGALGGDPRGRVAP